MLWFVLSWALGAEVVAVLPFTANTVGDALAPLGAAASDMLVTDLARADGLVVVERARLHALLAELELQQSAFIDPAHAARLGQGLGADQVVVGSLTVAAAGLRLDARVVDVATGTVVGTASASGSEQDFFALESEVAAQLYRHFGVELAVAEQGKPRTLDEALAGGARLQASDDAALRELRGVAVYRRDRLVRTHGLSPELPIVRVYRGSGALVSANELVELSGTDPSTLHQAQQRAKRPPTVTAIVASALLVGSVATIVAVDDRGTDIAASFGVGLGGIGSLAWFRALQPTRKVRLSPHTVYSVDQIDQLVDQANHDMASSLGVSERRRLEIEADRLDLP